MHPIPGLKCRSSSSLIVTYMCAHVQLNTQVEVGWGFICHMQCWLPSIHFTSILAALPGLTFRYVMISSLSFLFLTEDDRMFFLE